MAKNGHNAKAIAHAKYSVWVKKLNCLKPAENVYKNTLDCGHITEESIVYPGVFFCGALKLTRSAPLCFGPRCFVAGTFDSCRRLLSSRMK